MSKSEKPEKPEKPYKVGYGKPPEHTRFQKGKSGNPNGKPKGAKNKPRIHHSDDLRNCLLTEMNRGVQIREADGKVVTVPALAAIHRTLVQKALKGDRLAIKEVMKLSNIAYAEAGAIQLEFMKMIFAKEDADNERYAKMTRYEMELERAKHFKGKKGLRDLFGIKKYPIEAEEPVDERDWQAYRTHLENLRKGQPTQWPPAYWNE